MYLRWSEKKNFKTKIIEESLNENDGIKYSTIKIIGKFAFGWFKTESGVHRLIRKSPFNSENKRHTSFSSIFVSPENKKKVQVDINSKNLKINFYKSSGAGGQHVNKTESAVRITHIPTGITTKCQNNRSQHKNKKDALKQIKYKIYLMKIKKKEQKNKKIEDKKSNITWGNQIRSYILDDSRIKDLRTGMETRNIKNFLDGNIDEFVIKNLKKEN